MSYQALSAQMERITNFFGAPPTRNTLVPQNQNTGPIEIPAARCVDQVPENREQQVVPPQAQEEPESSPIQQARRNNYEDQNNIVNVVEALLAQNGFNMGLHRPNFVSSLSKYVLMTEFPRNWKVPKFTEFVGQN